ncbi:hypothetical protein PF010_g22708 [Phytophthora fragariae]|uniref:Uncharacterized protein n=2 Tax=Phytophthora fragariae TaxID=53985 RepID=A0A6A3QGP3_9STRA|nr:hypothetical protein PF003_g11145 [Phytophthora fragariae]KAE8925704.1 hypothetical protein PF009_g24094 [Phytophthora fragariae]KAE8992362.1 hypothetical protein PF011_g17577 [Phytophthora fragariae]KAE9075609.1 hypothetical protein PF007_g24936 [Phytophthora fragariae]KAE9079584.1 hypothetical protein PF010_g22708 [Phytophthora fragariae]
MGFSNSCLPSTLVAAFLLATANGHGYMTEPAVTFLSSSTDNTQFIATIESSASGFSGTFSGSPADNTAAFTTAFDSSSYTSLKDLINSLATVTVMGATLTCGSCDPDETAQPLPAEYVEWSHSSTEGFTASHEGPCEVWCDDVRVFHDADCAADYTSAPAELPYDRDACLGTSTLKFYWLALHSSTWQVYVNCAPLETTTSTGATSKYAHSCNCIWLGSNVRFHFNDKLDDCADYGQQHINDHDVHDSSSEHQLDIDGHFYNRITVNQLTVDCCRWQLWHFQPVDVHQFYGFNEGEWRLVNAINCRFDRHNPEAMV